MSRLIILGSLALCLLLHITSGQDQSSNYTVFDTKEACQGSCVGEHDLDCALSPKGDGRQHVCRCASGFYSRLDYCQIECEDKQFWSLFTYGACSSYQSTVLPGACDKQCVFRVRVWATVFIIILFVAAVIVIVALLPNFIVSCISCFRVRRQQRHIEDMQIVNSEISSGNTLGKGSHQPVLTSWNHPYAATGGYGQQHYGRY